MKFLLVLLALGMGASSAVQGATNGLLSGRIGLSAAVWLNALVVFLGASALWFLLPRTASGAEPSPWYLFLGGCYGLFIIAGAAFAFPRLGAGATTALMVAAQLGTALLLDGLGATGVRVPVTPLRLAGVLLLLVGALLVLWPRLAARNG